MILFFPSFLYKCHRSIFKGSYVFFLFLKGRFWKLLLGSHLTHLENCFVLSLSSSYLGETQAFLKWGYQWWKLGVYNKAGKPYQHHGALEGLPVAMSCCCPLNLHFSCHYIINSTNSVYWVPSICRPKFQVLKTFIVLFKSSKPHKMIPSEIL